MQHTHNVYWRRSKHRRILDLLSGRKKSEKNAEFKHQKNQKILKKLRLRRLQVSSLMQKKLMIAKDVTVTLQDVFMECGCRC